MNALNPHNIGWKNGEVVEWSHLGPEENANVEFNTRTKVWTVELIDFDETLYDGQGDWIVAEKLAFGDAVQWIKKNVVGPLVT